MLFREGACNESMSIYMMLVKLILSGILTPPSPDDHLTANNCSHRASVKGRWVETQQNAYRHPNESHISDADRLSLQAHKALKPAICRPCDKTYQSVWYGGYA